MSISVKRGSKIIKVIEDTIAKPAENKKPDYGIGLNVRTNRPFNTIEHSARLINNKREPVDLPIVNIEDAVAENIYHDGSIAREELVKGLEKVAEDLKVAAFDATSKFIPTKENAIKDPLNTFGLTEADFDETSETDDKKEKEVLNKSDELETSIADTAEKISEKYSSYLDDSHDNFEKIPRKKNKMDNY